jgi:predicted anti-sigma-YlaC factor YlaD
MILARSFHRVLDKETEVATDCQATQEMLTELGGEIERLDRVAQKHLEVCPGCREVAAAELALRRIFSEAIPPADPTIVGSVHALLGPARFRRRVVAFLPVAASLVVALLGVALVGGVPGGGVVAFLPGWSAQGWMALVTSASDWGVAVAAGARATAATLDPAMIVGAGLLSFLGLVAVAVTALRWRRVSPWRNDS